MVITKTIWVILYCTGDSILSKQRGVHVDAKYCPGNVNADAREVDTSIKNFPNLLVDSKKVGKICIIIM